MLKRVIDLSRITERNRRDISEHWRALCSTDGYLFSIWRQVLEEDEILLAEGDETKVMCIVYTKGITHIEGEYVCFLNFRPVGKFLQSFSGGAPSSRHLQLDVRNDFAAGHFQSSRLSAFGVDIKPVSTRLELEEFKRLIKSHKQGPARCYISIIAICNNKICGAATLDIDEDERMSAATCDKFGEGLYFLRRYFFIVRRMVAFGRSRWRIYRSILRNVCFMCSAFTRLPILIVGGHTHDPQPAASKEGFLLEVPKNPKHALFYWKPVRGFVVEYRKAGSEERVALNSYIERKGIRRQMKMARGSR
jgi:hypothetical protein